MKVIGSRGFIETIHHDSGWEPIVALDGERAQTRPESVRVVLNDGREATFYREPAYPDGLTEAGWDMLRALITNVLSGDRFGVDDLAERLNRNLGASVARSRAADLEAALRELVELKDGPRDEDYERRKPAAWERAREVLDG